MMRLITMVMALATTLSSAPQFVLPDPFLGVIDDKAAVLAWPSEDGKQLLDPSACSAHLVPAAQQTTEFVYPCGQWFLPPSTGSFDFWMEQGSRISDSQRVLRYNSPPGANAGARLVDTLTDGGYIRVSGPLAETDTYRLVGLTSPRFGFERRLSSQAAARPVHVPVGDFVTGVFSDGGEALALSRPVRVSSASTVRVQPVPPARGSSDILVVLQKPRGHDVTPEMKGVLTQGHVSRRPDVLRATKTRVFAIWYSVGVSPATVSVVGHDLAFRSGLLSLRDGKVTSVRGELDEIKDRRKE